jgi:hypothetical protein
VNVGKLFWLLFCAFAITARVYGEFPWIPFLFCGLALPIFGLPAMIRGLFARKKRPRRSEVFGPYV